MRVEAVNLQADGQSERGDQHLFEIHKKSCSGSTDSGRSPNGLSLGEGRGPITPLRHPRRHRRKVFL